MSQAGTVTRLAVRELWVTFRLFVVLAAFVGAGAFVAVLPAGPTTTLSRLSAAFAVAAVVAGGTAAWSVALDRVAGRAGWLVTRSVARGTYLAGWFVALSAVAVAGILAGGMLGWIALSSVSIGVRPGDYLAGLGAVTAASTTGIGLGLLVGLLLRASFAVAAVVLIAAAVVVATVLVGPIPPVSAFLVLPTVAGADPVLGAALRASGAALALTGGILVLARAALGRAEL